MRALTILDGLIQNAGTRFQRSFADEPLLERLRVAGTDSLSDAEVKAKCRTLFGQWAVSYKSTPGMEGVAALYKQLPKHKKTFTQEQSRVIRETAAPAEDDEDEADHSGHRQTNSLGGSSSRTIPVHPSVAVSNRPTLSPTASSFTSYIRKPKIVKTKPFNFEKEKPVIKAAIGEASFTSTSLMNAMKLVDREKKRVSEDPTVEKYFQECKQLRRRVLGYIQRVSDESFLGSLLQANDTLVEALMTWEVLDKSVEDDSDSEDDASSSRQGTARNRSMSSPRVQAQMAGLSLDLAQPPAQPPRPSFTVVPPSVSKGKEVEDSDEEEEEGEEEDENDPFADRNAVGTPRIEKDGMTW